MPQYLSVIAPVPVETPPSAEPMSNAKLLFLIGAGVVLFLLFVILVSRLLRKKN
ncbi:MAG TPA: hypothetical protein VF791_21470 [Pyrinomonadaceae bacterium]